MTEIKFGLEGQCQNKNCTAFKNMVVLEMKARVNFQSGS